MDCWLPVSRGLNGFDAKTSEEVINVYHVKKTAEVIYNYAHGNVFYVALQFPDHMLHVGPFICETLRLLTEAYKVNHEDCPTFGFFLLGDTSYGECCVDEVAAQHLSCDLVVHYGNACLSPTRTLPVLYVYPRATFGHPRDACTIFRESIIQIAQATDAEKVIILFDLELESCFTNDSFQAGEHQVSFSSLQVDIDIQVAALRIYNAQTVRTPGTVGSNGDGDGTVVGPHVISFGTVPADKTAFVWYTRCEEDASYPPLLRNAAIQLGSGASNPSRKFFSVSLVGEPRDAVQLIEPSRILRKRFAVVGKIQGAERVGIIPGTLGVSGNTDIIERCKALVNLAGKRPYVILVGKPNPVKLANYPEIDVFVLVACPQNGLIDDKEYLRPIATPFELEAAILMDGDIFSEPYSMDFQELLKKELRSPDYADDERQLISRSSNWSLAVDEGSSGAGYLKSRHWQGLKYGEGGSDDETRVEQLPTLIERGEYGIASGYSREQEANLKGNEQSYQPH
ncbi:Diphthamide synthesis DPH1/DPH2 [Gracilaria domingensis]|nr:Diphthamide synthesis DPH1/DPH2 [Gracilaria domingensis]